MKNGFSNHIRSNIVGYVALFVALSASAYALPGKNTVDTGDIANGQVRSRDIGTGQVRVTDLADGSVTSAKVADNSLTGADVAESSLGQVPSAQAADTATSATSANTAGDANTLDGIDSTGFLVTNAQAGGDLGGPLSNLQIASNAVGTNEVDASLTGADIANAPSGSDQVNADTIDGTDGSDLIRRDDNQSTLGRDIPGFFSYFMDTGGTNTFEFGRFEIRATGVAGQFKVCANAGITHSYVLYLNGVRSAQTAQVNSNCTTTFNAGDDGDFEISGDALIVFGVSANGSANSDYNLIGFQL